MDNTFTTTNRRLEQFMFAHKIDFLRQGRNADGMTHWVYIRTPYFEEVLKEFKTIWIDHERRGA